MKTLTHNEKAKIIAELTKRNCSTDESWFIDLKTLGDWVYKRTGKSIPELLES